MKKILAAISCIMLLMTGLMLTGCGGSDEADIYADSQYVGNWNATGAEYDGNEIDIDSVIDGGFTVALNSDGSTVLTVSGEETSGVWEPSEDGVMLSGDEDLTMVDNDGSLVLDYDGVTINFEKE